ASWPSTTVRKPLSRLSNADGSPSTTTSRDRLPKPERINRGGAASDPRFRVRETRSTPPVCRVPTDTIHHEAQVERGVRVDASRQKGACRPPWFSVVIAEPVYGARKTPGS